MAGFSRTRTAGEWWSIYALLSPDELFHALSQFPTLAIFITNRRVPADHSGSMRLDEYIGNYDHYVDSLTGGRKLDNSVKNKLHVSLSLDASIFRSEPCPDPNFKVFRYSKPVVQVQELQAAYLERTNKVQVNCMSMTQPIHFGLTFSHHNVWNAYAVDPSNPYDSSRFPNIELIDKLTGWIRKHSKPCKLTIRDKEQSVGVRLGQQVLCWINEHSELARLSISVKTGRSMNADPFWLTPTVLQLAQAISDERAYDRLAILADALEDSGCTNQNILGHCRQKRDHVRECWVVDLLLRMR